MPEEKPLILDCTQENAPMHNSGAISILSSYKRGWKDIFLELHHLPAFETPELYHPEHIITIPTRYVAKVEEIAGGKIQVAPFCAGDVMLAPPGFYRKYRWEQEIQLIHLILKPELIKCVAHESVEPDNVELLPHFIKSDPLIYQIGLALKAELETNGSSNCLYAESATTFLAAHLLRNYSARKHSIPEYEGGLTQHKLKQAKDFIQAHLEEISLEAIANHLGMSRYHFCRLFKQSVGISPHQYVIQQRVERAKQLLLQGKMSLAEIAIACGFSHQSHLNRHFKRLTGVTPKTLLNS